MPHTLLLFDIDGTLISGSRAGQTAYVEAIRSCFNIELGLQGYSTAGKTDLLIMKELLESNGVSNGEIDLEYLAKVYLQSLKKTVLRDPGIILPGVDTLLNKLSDMKNIFLALGTGNLEEAARIKLRFHNLDRYFQTGGFGSDAIKRPDLIALGIKKASGHFQVSFQHTIVVGDTPYDILAAVANEAYSIAVATGSYSFEDLQKTGATQVLPDLKDSETFVKIIDSLPPKTLSILAKS